MYRLYLFSILFFLSCSCTVQQNDSFNKEKLLKERQRLKDFAFCQCLQHVYKSDSIFIRDGSSSGYFETGSYSIDVYNTIDSITKVFSTKIYKSKEGHPLGIMKCLDFYNSKELDELTRQFDKDLIKQRIDKKKK